MDLHLSESRSPLHPIGEGARGEVPRVRRILIDSFSENLAPGLASLTHYSAMGGWAYFRDEAIILIATEADPLAGKSGWLQLTQVCITAFET